MKSVDSEYERRWMEGETPFDGLTMSTQDYIPVGVLRRALRTIVFHLQRRWGEADLFSLHDWHFHDSYVSTEKPIAWAEILAIVSTDENVIDASPGDDQVFLGIFPEDRDWYLRFYVPEIDDLPGCEYLTRHGRFDLTGPSNLVKSLEREIQATGLQVKSIPAVAFFHRGF